MHQYVLFRHLLKLESTVYSRSIWFSYLKRSIQCCQLPSSPMPRRGTRKGAVPVQCRKPCGLKYTTLSHIALTLTVQLSLDTWISKFVFHRLSSDFVPHHLRSKTPRPCYLWWFYSTFYRRNFLLLSQNLLNRLFVFKSEVRFALKSEVRLGSRIRGLKNMFITLR